MILPAVLLCVMDDSSEGTAEHKPTYGSRAVVEPIVALAAELQKKSIDGRRIDKILATPIIANTDD